MKKMLTVFLSAVLIANLLPVSLLAAPEDETTETVTEEAGESTEEAPAAETKELVRIELRTAEDLEELSLNCHDDAWSVDKEVLLMNDINLNESAFTSIPIFNGHFDGQGHRITGYSYGGDGYVTAFFRYLEKDAYVEGLTISAQIFATGSQQVTGGIVGMNSGTVENCCFEGRIRGRSESGGIAGINLSDGNIFSCENKGGVSGYYYTGGIAGKNYGMIAECTNSGSLNASVEWVEEDDAMSGDLIGSLTGGEDVKETRVQTGVDTGGIAGFSRGVIIGCTNQGTVGYEHTGYNIGGIAGRQSGSLATCTNNGTVLGRKDVGGIVGQMEPYIELMDREELSDEVTELHDMVNDLLDMMDEDNETVRRDLQLLQAQADNAADIGDAMAGQAEDYVNSNIDVVNEADRRVKYVLQQMPEVTTNVTAAGDSMQQSLEYLQKIDDDTDLLSHMTKEERKKVKELRAEIEALTAELKELREKQDPTIRDLRREAEIVSKLSSDTAQLTGLYAPYVKDAGGDLDTDVNSALDHLSDSAEAAAAAQDALSSINAYLNAQQDLQLVKIDEQWSDHVDSINQQLDAMSGTMSKLGEHSEEYTKEVNEQLRRINDQMNSIYEKIRQEAEQLTGKEGGKIYSDISDAELETITLGKVSGSVNYGVIRGDINIGGVTGSMSIDEEDPEENAAGTSNMNLNGRYTTQNVIQSCTNRGYVTAKNDGAGGVVGYMRSGVVVRCFGYGSVESTEGNYVGGIAGQSLSALRDNAVLCSLSGGNYVGGIAGYGTIITGCYAMPMVQRCSGRCGAVAGSIKINDDTKEPELSALSDNHYVSDVLYGIDQISYDAAAAELSYRELLDTPGIPAEFRKLTVIFRVDDVYLGTKTVNYGDKLSDLEYPEIPKKEGYFGRWPELPWDTVMGNLVITGEYVDAVKVLASESKDPESGRLLALVDRDFDDSASLSVSVVADTLFTKSGYEASVVYSLSIDATDLPDTEEVRIRLYDPFEGDEVELWRYSDGNWVKQESIKRGSYVQLTMQGSSAIYALAKPEPNRKQVIAAISVAGALLVLIIIIRVIKRIRRR
ncbi:MAG: hypothetical protein IK115_11165 [Lachnospiraceae bacterium]|nr:hypothetical protein [Lachnospiraceae bacterium]